MAGAPEAPASMEALASHTASLALDSSRLASWFKPELFTEPEFSPVGYVSDLKRYVRPRCHQLRPADDLWLPACASRMPVHDAGTVAAPAHALAEGRHARPPPAQPNCRRRRCRWRR